MAAEPGSRLLRIHLSEGDQHGGKPLYEALVDLCRAMGIAGATVFRGLEGFGETAGLHKAHLMGHAAPMVVVAVDTAENIARLAVEAEAMVGSGVLSVCDVKAVRVQKHTPDG